MITPGEDGVMPKARRACQPPAWLAAAQLDGQIFSLGCLKVVRASRKQNLVFCAGASQSTNAIIPSSAGHHPADREHFRRVGRSA